ncbi:MAG: acetolactate decarboxylase [Synechococcus sp.]
MTLAPDATHALSLRLGEGLWQALQERCRRTGESPDHVIRAALAEALDVDHHTLYQVSTSGALVQGVYQGCVRVRDILRHGDFGLGTFDGLDGEGILLDGTCWQACSDGSVRPAPLDALAPFWVATRFQAEDTRVLSGITSWADLTTRLDGFRPSANQFTAIRIRGHFERIKVRVACRAAAGTDLVSATAHQAEFSFEDLTGVLVGFWTPEFARTINVPGYHLHLLSDDHAHGGHVLDLQAAQLSVELHSENHLQLALPETAAFLAADLRGDPSASLAKAEGDHS